MYKTNLNLMIVLFVCVDDI